MHPVVTIRK